MKDQAATVLCFEHATIARDCMDTLQALGFNVIPMTYSPEVFTKLPFLSFDYLFSGVVAQISQQIMISPAPSDRYTRGFLTGRPRVFSLFIALTYAITSPT